MTDQLELGGMPARLFACTPSKLATYADCPRRFRHTYLDRPRPPRGRAWAHTSLGASVHTALAGWWFEPPPRRTPAVAAQLLTQRWVAEGYRDDAQAASFLTLARGWVERLVATLDPHDEPRGVERVVSARTSTLALSGRVDRIDERDGELVVVDYKTGRWVPDHDDVRSAPALALYAVAAARTLRQPCHRVELHHLPTGTVAAHEHDDAALARHVERAEAVAADAVRATALVAAGADPDASFPVRPGAACAWCDHRDRCPSGRAAAPDRDRWSSLPDLPRVEPAELARAGSGQA